MKESGCWDKWVGTYPCMLSSSSMTYLEMIGLKGSKMHNCWSDLLQFCALEVKGMHWNHVLLT